MHRSEITIDLGALRRNARRLRDVLGESELWAVVKADGYGHGAVDVAGALLGEGAAMLCVATMAEALELRREFAEARLLVMGPTGGRELAAAREARIEVTAIAEGIPEGVRVHLKLDTGMGRWGLRELPEVPTEVVGLMTHLATADSDPEFAREQLRRFEEATRRYSHLERHAANSAAALRLPEARLDAARCGIALYGLSPFGGDPHEDGLEPVLRWESRIAQVKQLAPGESTGYGRRFAVREPTWIGIVPIGYADGFRRDLAGTHVVVEGERRPVVGTISMDAIAVELSGRLAADTPVTLIGDGLLAEEHAAVAETINYEIVCRLNTRPARARRSVVDA
jgi:alanine racemase